MKSKEQFQPHRGGRLEFNARRLAKQYARAEAKRDARELEEEGLAELEHRPVKPLPADVPSRD